MFDDDKQLTWSELTLSNETEEIVAIPGPIHAVIDRSLMSDQDDSQSLYIRVCVPVLHRHKATLTSMTRIHLATRKPEASGAVLEDGFGGRCVVEWIDEANDVLLIQIKSVDDLTNPHSISLLLEGSGSSDESGIL